MFWNRCNKTISAATVIGIYAHFGGVHSLINGDHIDNGDSLMEGLFLLL